MTSVHVKPLPQDVDKDQLKSLFQSYGEVLSVCIKEKRNYAFVEMSTAEEAQEAINQLNNTEWMDITLTVSESTGFRNPNNSALCFNCQGSGHWAKECPEPNRVKRRPYRAPPSTITSSSSSSYSSHSPPRRYSRQDRSYDTSPPLRYYSSSRPSERYYYVTDQRGSWENDHDDDGFHHVRPHHTSKYHGHERDRFSSSSNTHRIGYAHQHHTNPPRSSIRYMRPPSPLIHYVKNYKDHHDERYIVHYDDDAPPPSSSSPPPRKRRKFYEQ